MFKQENEYHKRDCLNRDCQNCGIAKFKLLDEEKDSSDAAPLVKWRKFGYVVIADT